MNFLPETAQWQMYDYRKDPFPTEASCKSFVERNRDFFIKEANRFETYRTKEPYLNPGASNSFPLVDINTLRPEEDFKFEISHSLFWLSTRYVVNESSIVFTDEQLNPRSRYRPPPVT